MYIRLAAPALNGPETKRSGGTGGWEEQVGSRAGVMKIVSRFSTDELC